MLSLADSGTDGDITEGLLGIALKMREEYNKLGFMRESLQVEIDRLSIVKQIDC